MTDEAFLAALAADPFDAVTRAVYADWLEERGDMRASFLRTDVDAARLGSEAGGQAVELADALDLAWVAAAGARWDVWLLSFDPTRKIQAIMNVRDLLDIGLADGKRLVESAPVTVVRGVVLPAALRAAAALRLIVTDAAQVAVRPATAARDAPWPERLHPLDPHAVVALRLKGDLAQSAGVLREFTEQRLPEEGPPAFLRRFRTEAEARTFAEPLRRYAELHHFTLPPGALKRKPVFGPGGRRWDLWLLASPPDIYSLRNDLQRLVGLTYGQAWRVVVNQPALLLTGLSDEAADVADRCLGPHGRVVRRPFGSGPP